MVDFDFGFGSGFGNDEPKREEFAAEALDRKAPKPAEKVAGSYKHLQAKLTPEEYREVNIHLIHNDITNKAGWLRKIILREVRGYNEPMESDERV